MSVPLDRLYHYLADVVNHDLVIYRWAPHGSRKLEDLTLLRAGYQDDWAMMVCHDQEPLNSTLYSSMDFDIAVGNYFQNHHGFAQFTYLTPPVVSYLASLGFRGLTSPGNQFDQTLLLHSEQHSAEVDKFVQQGYVPVYYWSHGMIALDWFRYAEHDPVLTFDTNQIQKDFLIYNRAWAGTREYRLCFVEQIVERQLDQHCKISFNACDVDGHYSQHKFVNPAFQITNFNLEDLLPTNIHDATASADYCGEDYTSTAIEVVLETLFDDSRWHLTEKALRPIACGKPFILMATPGSLTYLKQYGFETFAGLIDESYDQIVNPRQRLQAVVNEMTRISVLAPAVKLELYTKLHEIAKRNQRRFFGEFFDQVQQEYVNNVEQAMTVMKQHCSGYHNAAIKKLLQ